MAKRYDIEIPSVVERTVVHEEVIFRGKKIIRERIVKKIKLPKIINNDYSYEMFTGFKSNVYRGSSKSTGITEVNIDLVKYK